MAEIKIEDVSRIEYIERSVWFVKNEIEESVTTINIDVIHKRITGVNFRFSEKQTINLARDILNVINNIVGKSIVIDGPFGEVNIYLKNNQKLTYDIHDSGNNGSSYSIIEDFMIDNDVY